MNETDESVVENNQETPYQEKELGLMQKVIGVITEPGKTFNAISRFPVKTMDWLIPVILVICVAIISNFAMMSVPEIKEEAIDKQLSAIGERFKTAVENGELTQEQADQQLEIISGRIENQMSSGMIIQAVAIVIFVFFIYFIVATLFFLVARFIFKDHGDYNSSLVAFGLPYYISIIQLIVLMIAAIASKSLLTGTSVGVFMETDPMTWKGFLLGKLDIFTIWFYTAVSIGYAKMFKSNNTVKYAIIVFGLWLGFSTLIFMLAQSFPMLSNFVR